MQFASTSPRCAVHERLKALRPAAASNMLLYFLAALLLSQAAAASMVSKDRHMHDILDARRELPSRIVPRAPLNTIVAANDFPEPFDSSLGDNFTTTTCPQFFESFLNNPQFQSCHAVSMLLVTSNGFFQATRNSSQLTDILQTSCAANSASCSTLFSQLAAQLTSPSACEQDFNAQNPSVLQAYQGFLAYAPVYNATCMTDPSAAIGSSTASSAGPKAKRATTSSSSSSTSTASSSSSTSSSTPTSTAPPYCFVSAFSSKVSANTLMYYLPLGISLSRTPSCSTCLQRTLDAYAQWASNSTLPLSTTYADAVSMVDGACGSNYVKAASTVSAAPSLKNGVWTAMVVAVMAAHAML